ncbi:hypothetical protein T4C_7121 [Trichinella pseudospiralis]|uniref:Integrase zinc-binding domain-containing protein n=1 Tax=Trichinella pseudospiralis TaxID=6337 RepID=A0A0V1J2S4_TRIPS|nr:hypothetical protein T4C_7121 [Trichinella pseudospiralis]
MYLQILMREENRDACRFLWWDGERRIRSYRLTRVCFGLKCSPFLAMGTVRSHAQRHEESAPRAAKEVLNNMYMDDLATSCNSVEEAQTLVDQLDSLLASGGFHLHKWASNEPDALRAVPAEKTARGTGGCPGKTLGIFWDRNGDHLTFMEPEKIRPQGGNTKRQMLSAAACVSDPLGCLAPFLVRAKILFQSLWEKGADWDEPLPEEVERPWVNWKQELADLPLCRLPRALVPVPLELTKRIELHAFWDASERAYGEVAYLRLKTPPGSVRVNLVAAKTRVAVKRLSLPRLELMGALTSARLIRFSDSEVTLAWVRSAACRWKPFVRNRVEEIQQLVEPACWRHCPGKSNPADLLSRGSSLKEFAESDIWAWPLKRDPSEGNPPLPPDEDQHPHCALLVSVVAHTSTDRLHPEKFSNIERMFRISALCLRFVRNCRSAAGNRRSGPLTAEELDEAEVVWVRIPKKEGFRREIETTLNVNSWRTAVLGAQSRLLQLSPYLDEAATLRVGGRLVRSHLPPSEKHPAILPSDHGITRELIVHFHLRQLHAGAAQTLATMRQRYWIA